MAKDYGLKALAELNGLKPLSGVRQGLPPEPPDRLGVAEKEVWLEVVNSRPWDYFPKFTHQMLENYCHAVLRLRMLQKLWDKCKFEDCEPASADLDDLVKVKAMSEMIKDLQRQSSVVHNLARQLRITVMTTTAPESTTTAKANKFAHAPERPWEIGEKEAVN